MRCGCRTHVFTFAELLAAMLLVAVVVPVALHGIHVAGRVSRSSLVRETAARLADAKLHELALTGAWQSGESTGVFEDWADYNWEMATEDWTEDDEAGTAMTLLSVTVSTVAVGAEQSAVLTTLVQGSSE